MIAPQELRIGNWVEADSIYAPTKREFVQILSIWNYGDSYVYNASILDGCIDIWLKNIDPIPLSPEILSKCGFIFSNTRDNAMNNFSIRPFLNSPRMVLGFYVGVCDKMTLFQWQGETYDTAKPIPMHFGSNHPIYLHQLQNLVFALSGEELNIQLP